MTVVVGCTEDTSSGPTRRNRGEKDDDTTNTPPTNDPSNTPSTSAAITACSAVAAPTELSTAPDAVDIRLAGNAVFFQTGALVNRVLKNGTNKATVFTSPNLTHSWADAKGLILVESTGPDNPAATLRTFGTTKEEGAPDPAFPEFPVVLGEGGPGGATAGTNFNSASTRIFAADDNNYYLLAEDQGNGNSLIVAVNRGNPAAQAVLVNSESAITNPQIASGAVWYVEDNNRIFKVALQTEDTPAGTPSEVFGLGTQCNLAVNESLAFCSVGTEILTRDLSGASPKQLIAVTASKAPKTQFGQPFYFDGQLYLRGLAPDQEIKNIIRAISTGATADEKLVACNREGTITNVTVDKENVVWAEQGKGVFMTTR